VNRSKIVAIVTGIIAVALSIVYLVIVQLLDFRGEMVPAPQSQVMSPQVIAQITIDASLLTPHPISPVRVEALMAQAPLVLPVLPGQG